MPNLTPPRLNTQGPIEEFLRQVYKWSLTVLDGAVELIADVQAELDSLSTIVSGLQTDILLHEFRLDFDDAMLADHETRLDALEADESANKTTVYHGGVTATGGTANASYYHAPTTMPASPSNGVIEPGQIYWGRDGTLKNLRWRLVNTPVANANTYDVIININGSDTTLKITGIQSSDTAQKSDITHSVSISKGDLLTLRTTIGTSGTQTNSARWSFDFEEP